MKQFKLFAFCLSVVLLVPSLASASVIGFGTSDLDHLAAAGTQTESGFSYSAIGTGWELQTFFSNPGAALVTFFNVEGSAAGQTVDFVRTGGGTFKFNSVDFRTISAFNSDQVTFTGFLAGNSLGTLNLNTSSTTFSTVGSGFGTTSIDLLRLTITRGTANGASNAAILDNLVFDAPSTSVPEPVSVASLAGGILALAAWSRSRKA